MPQGAKLIAVLKSGCPNSRHLGKTIKNLKLIQADIDQMDGVQEKPKRSYFYAPKSPLNYGKIAVL